MDTPISLCTRMPCTDNPAGCDIGVTSARFWHITACLQAHCYQVVRHIAMAYHLTKFSELCIFSSAVTWYVLCISTRLALHHCHFDFVGSRFMNTWRDVSIDCLSHQRPTFWDCTCGDMNIVFDDMSEIMTRGWHWLGSRNGVSKKLNFFFFW